MKSFDNVKMIQCSAIHTQPFRSELFFKFPHMRYARTIFSNTFYTINPNVSNVFVRVSRHDQSKLNALVTILTEKAGFKVCCVYVCMYIL